MRYIYTAFHSCKMVRTQTQTRAGLFKNLNSKIQKKKLAKEGTKVIRKLRTGQRTVRYKSGSQGTHEDWGTATRLTLGQEQTNQQKNEGTTQAWIQTKLTKGWGAGGEADVKHVRNTGEKQPWKHRWAGNKSDKTREVKTSEQNRK